MKGAASGFRFTLGEFKTLLYVASRRESSSSTTLSNKTEKRVCKKLEGT
jgi:hypothetical protein